ncbi:MAG TPA: CHASE sensor domain-containing protein [Terriglobales bacterium]|jgi:signal transduction histidine kinase
MMNIMDSSVSTIARRLTFMNVMVSGTALLLACLAFLGYDQFSVREALVRNLSAQARIIGTNSVSALVFNDPQAAQTTLMALKDSPAIEAAAIFTADGRMFAHYSRSGNDTALHALAIPSGATEEHEFTLTQVVLVRTVIADGKPVGTVYIRSDLSALERRLVRYGLISVVVIALSLLAALLVSRSFRKSVADPIVHLAEVATQVSREKNYSIRARSTHEFLELTTLTGAFNDMLRQIEAAQATLEARVADRTRQLAAANRELEAFSYSVSHDLRGPLDTINAYAYLLQSQQSDKLDATGRECVTEISAQVVRMAQLIEDLLNLSRVASSELHREAVDLSDMAKSICAGLKRTEPNREVDFRVQECGRPQCDPRLIRIVLDNLIRNAWKYTSAHPRATIEFGCIDKGRSMVFYVRDDGAGFDQAQAVRLFKPFQRLHSAGEFQGTGIGLTIVQRIIHRHGGDIWAEGAVDRGATFYFTLGNV